jgi:hypothetical protein
MADIEKLSRRPAEYLADAGVPQLASGSVFFFLGSSVVVRSLLPRTFVAQEAPKWAGICLALGVFWAVKKLKQRVVFPRSGYAEPQPIPSARALLWTSIPVIILLPVLALLGYRPDLSSRVVWPAFAIVFAVIGLVSGIQQGSRLMINFGSYCVCLDPL